MIELNKLQKFLTADIWRIRASRLKKNHSFWIKQLRILLLALRGFQKDKCQLRASALTFYTMLSIVPILAMAFGIAKGFGMEGLLEEQLRDKMPGQPELVSQILQFSHSFLQSTQGSLIAGVGVVILFYTVIQMLSNIEASFNDIWGVKKGRSFWRKFTDYLSMMVFFPILLLMSTSFAVIIASQVTFILESLARHGLASLSYMILMTLKLLPFVMMSLLFTFLYVFMPNTKVKIRSAILGGIIAGTIYQIGQFVYLNFQIGVSKFGVIYGSFAALPLFLIWLQISWLIVLFGAEIVFAEQNVDTYEFEPDCFKASRNLKKTVALAVAHLCIKKFDRGEPALTANEIAQTLETPIRLVKEVIFDLTESGVLVEIRADHDVVAYQPARNIEDLTIERVLQLIENHGEANIPMVDSEDLKKIKRALKVMEKNFENSPDNKALKDI